MGSSKFWQIIGLVIGIVLIIVGFLYFEQNSQQNFFPSVIVGAIGGIIVLIIVTKWRNQLNNWMDK
jgi:uncharacterized membrane protein YeaQ/YmgE (transglycosylase-associated protein family)